MFWGGGHDVFALTHLGHLCGHRSGGPSQGLRWARDVGATVSGAGSPERQRLYFL
jgi:hypothetical protein